MVDAGVRFQCFDFDGFKALLKLDVAHDEALAKVKLQAEQVVNLGLESEALKRAIEAQERVVGLLRTENTRLGKKWEEENKLRHEAENDPGVGSWLGWAAAGGLGMTTAVLLGVVLLD